MRASRWLWLVVVSLGVAVLQVTIADQLSIDGVHVELVWVLPIAAGLVAGPVPGMAAGLVGGAVVDLFLPTPFGLTALIGVVVGYVLGRLGEEGIGDLGGAAWWVAPGLAFCAGLVAPLLYAAVGAAFGHHSYLTVPLGVISVMDAIGCALLVRPAMRLLGPLLATDTSRALDPVRGAA